MSIRYKPVGYNSVSPYLIVKGAAGTIDFLARVAGATELYRKLDAQGHIAHAEVRIDDSVLMLADSTEGWAPVPCHVHIYVPDVDDAYRRALDAGAESVSPPAQKDDPDRRCGVRDAGGTTWWLGTHVE
jgi:uncharacterized glyoxalase superfamily protein PhnB